MVLSGQYGPYVQLGAVTEAHPKPKRASLPKGMKPEDVTLDVAVGLLALPRLLGTHPKDGGRILAGQGRFGPYVVHELGKGAKDYRSLKPPDHVLSVTLQRALELLALPKQTRGRRTALPLKELGPHPVDQQPVAVYSGQYGPYVKHGSVSASIPKGHDPAGVTLAEAVELLEAKRRRPLKRAAKPARAAQPAKVAEPVKAVKAAKPAKPARAAKRPAAKRAKTKRA